MVLPVGQPGAPASSTSLPAWFVSWWTGIGDSAACLLCGVSSCTGLDALRSSTLHTAMHCRSFRDDDILKCLEQFCGWHV